VIDFKYPLAVNTWDEGEVDAIQSVIASGRLTMGQRVLEFEREFASFHGVKHAVMVNSGSSANLLMVAALFFVRNEPLKRGDEVIVPAVSWSTTYAPLQQHGLKVKFVDIDLDTLNFDLQQLEKSITDKTRMIFAVNLLGNSNDYKKIESMIGGRKIILLEDNCESLGAEFDGRLTGTFGLMSSFSSYFSHHICTMEGGLILTDNDELYEILLCLRAHGWTRNLPSKSIIAGDRSSDYFDESFRFILPGYNLRPLEIEGAVGSVQLAKLEGFLKKRRDNAFRFLDKISGHPELIIQKEIGISSWFGFSLVIRQGSALTRNVLRSVLEGVGIECRPIVAGDFTKKELLKYFDFDQSIQGDNASWIDRNGLFIGNCEYSYDDLSRLWSLNHNGIIPR